MTFAQRYLAIALCSSQVEKQDVKLIAWFPKLLIKKVFDEKKEEAKSLYIQKKIVHVYYSSHAAVHYNPLP